MGKYKYRDRQHFHATVIQRGFRVSLVYTYDMYLLLVLHHHVSYFFIHVKMYFSFYLLLWLYLIII